MKGHQDRICRVAFHPSGDYVASASFDTTWRLWDVNTSKELLLQEGHSKEVYAVEFQDDGALAASGFVVRAKVCSVLTQAQQWARRRWTSVGSTDRTNSHGSGWPRSGHIWHLFLSKRVGLSTKCVALIEDLCSYQIATGAGDDTIRIWDMRSLRALYTIAAHTSNVADVRFFRYSSEGPAPPVVQDATMNGQDGEGNPDARHDAEDKTQEERRYRSGLYLASAGYDGLVKLWSADDWQLLRTITTDASKVMSVDLSADAQLLSSGTYNRNFQLFGMEDSML
jgi:U4/U6 small nuclear ribonucleoprotein PRP4